MNTGTNYFELSKAKNYQKIIDDLLPVAEGDGSISGANLSYLLDALNKMKRYDDAVSIGKKHFAEVKNNKYALNSLCFGVYMSRINPHLSDEEVSAETAKTAGWIIDHYPKEAGSFIWANSLFRAVDFALAHNDLQKAGSLLSLAKADEFNDEVKEIVKDGKTIRLKSDRSKYLKYSFELAKAKGDNSEALRICELMLEKDPTDIWNLRRKAQVLEALGKNEESMTIYRQVLQRKTDWFIWHEAAKLALKVGQDEDAKVYFSRAFNAAGSQTALFIWHLLIDIAQFLEKHGKSDLANKHLEYVFHAATDDNGNKPQEMLKFFFDRKIKPAENIDLKALLKELKAYHSENEFTGEKHSGTVSRMNEGGKTGFINSNGKSYFFLARNFRGKNPKEGLAVTFHLEKHTNPKTGNEEDQAVGVAISD